LVGLALGLGLSACAPATSRIAALAAEGRANLLRAHAAHRDEEMRVEGVVLEAGLKNVETVEGYRTNSAMWTAREGTVRYPYLVARDPGHDATAGELLCFFDPEEIDDVAALSPGDQVTVRGTFQEFSAKGGRVVLNACMLE
jgi:hypothetical protein